MSGWLVWNSGIVDIWNNSKSKKRYFCLYGNLVFHFSFVLFANFQQPPFGWSCMAELHVITCAAPTLFESKQQGILPSCLRIVFSFHRVFFFPGQQKVSHLKAPKVESAASISCEQSEQPWSLLVLSTYTTQLSQSLHFDKKVSSASALAKSSHSPWK